MKLFPAETFYKIKSNMELTRGGSEEKAASGARRTADHLRNSIVAEAAGSSFLILADSRFLIIDTYVDLLRGLPGRFAVCLFGGGAPEDGDDGPQVRSTIQDDRIRIQNGRTGIQDGRIKIYFTDYDNKEGFPSGMFPEYGLVFDFLNLTGPALSAADAEYRLAELAEGCKGRGLPFITVLNKSGCRVISAGFPFGVDPASGEMPLGDAIKCGGTIPLPGPFPCHFIFPGVLRSGSGSFRNECISGIDAPDCPGYADNSSLEYFPAEEASVILPRVAPKVDEYGSKYTNGRVLVIAGSRKYPGAALLAADASQHCGVGFTEIAAPGCLEDIIPSVCPEALRIPLGGKAVRYLKYKHVGTLLDLSRRADSVVIGPGLGREQETVEAVIAFLLHSSAKKIVVDADALFALSVLLRKKHGATLVKRIFRDKDAVITPHVGEAAYLLDETVGYTGAKRLETARILSDLTGSVVLLKGRDTITYLSDSIFTVNGTGDPALSKGGSGDVLSGIIGGLMAKGHGAYDAARFGAYVHGLAADRAASKKGAAGTLPGDLSMELKSFL